MSLQTFSREALQANKWLLFILLCTLTFLLLLIKKSFLESGTAAFEVLEMQGEAGLLKMISALQFATIPLVYVWKFMIIALLLWVGCFFFGYNISYVKCFGIAIVAEFIFLVPEVYKIMHFLLLSSDFTLYQINVYYPFSLVLLIDPLEVAPKWIYPLKALNIFEVLYWGVLFYLLHLTAGKQKWVPLVVVGLFYVFPFLIWLLYYSAVY